MKIKIIMHTALDAHLKPDFALVQDALENIDSLGSCKNQAALSLFKIQVSNIEFFLKQEELLSQQIKTEADLENKAELQKHKKYVTSLIDKTIEKCLSSLAQAGGGDLYHYHYDLHFNRVVAGLMGATCYMKDTFDALQQKDIKNILAIASIVETNGHHSTFGHSHLTLEISGIPKALAMIINNEKEYCTSEKSARYTLMSDVEPAQSTLYDKWKEIFVTEINQKYGDKHPFFDEKGIKAGKLAQENARYMISVFTPTNMVYTTSFRQLNYLAHWFEDVISDPNANEFYAAIKPQMKEFVLFVKGNSLYSPLLEDHKDRKLSLFGDGILKDVMTDSVYALAYKTSFACLAQLQRHRTIHYNIDEYDFSHGAKSFYTPPILSDALAGEWQKDIQSLADSYPQGMLVPVIEKGEINDFLLKAKERVCVCAQKEIRDLIQQQCGKFALALQQDAKTASLKSISYGQTAIWVEGESEADLIKTQAAGMQQLSDKLTQKAQVFEKLSHGARCTAGYQCQSPCQFAEGVKLESKI